ncbi:hypothetical protein Tco_0402042 [Tanacetum coccineum]
MRVVVAYGGGDEGVVVVVEDEARGGGDQLGPLQDPTTSTITTITLTNGDGMQRVRTFEKQYPQNKVQQMRGARGRAYAMDGGIWYSVVSSRMNQLH